MAVVDILQYPDKRLRRKGEQITDFKEASVQKMIDDMIETLYASRNCAGLSATQMDFENPGHITVIDFSPNKSELLCLVNAQIVEQEGEVLSSEGCMSVQGIDARVKRAKTIQVQGQDRHGTIVEFRAEGFLAKVIQHELDHLAGILFIDYLSPLKKQLLKRKLMALARKKQAVL